MSNTQTKTFFLLTLVGMFTLLPRAESAELLRSIWACHVPCVSPTTPEKTLKHVRVTYCGTHVLTKEMLQEISPLCARVNNTPDAEARRTGPNHIAIADCISAGNTCEKEGITHSGYTCSLLCPESSAFPSKYSVCAQNAEEAWAMSSKICPGARRPESIPLGKVCTADGQTHCSP